MPARERIPRAHAASIGIGLMGVCAVLLRWYAGHVPTDDKISLCRIPLLNSQTSSQHLGDSVNLWLEGAVLPTCKRIN